MLMGLAFCGVGGLGYKFFRSEDLRCLATRIPTLAYQFVTNKQASFHLWWKEKLVKHQKF